jgi:transposase-like protein
MKSEAREKAVAEFNKLPDRDKWDTWKKQKGTFHCPRCEARSKPERCSPFPGNTRYCGDCSHELTHRTGGGQNDPFRWILMPLPPCEIDGGEK